MEDRVWPGFPCYGDECEDLHDCPLCRTPEAVVHNDGHFECYTCGGFWDTLGEEGACPVCGSTDLENEYNGYCVLQLRCKGCGVWIEEKP